MKAGLHYILIPISLISVPLFWFIFNMSGCRITMLEFYKECIEHIKSGEKFGPLDQDVK